MNRSNKGWENFNSRTKLKCLSKVLQNHSSQGLDEMAPIKGEKTSIQEQIQMTSSFISDKTKILSKSIFHQQSQ